MKFWKIEGVIEKQANGYQEYMLYLIMRPSMLPIGIGEISFQDTCAEATEFVKDRHSIQHEKHVYQMLHKLVSRDIDKVSQRLVTGKI
jgi:hypothetical protein